jgi:hypothetical protein
MNRVIMRGGNNMNSTMKLICIRFAVALLLGLFLLHLLLDANTRRDNERLIEENEQLRMEVFELNNNLMKSQAE